MSQTQRARGCTQLSNDCIIKESMNRGFERLSDKGQQNMQN